MTTNLLKGTLAPYMAATVHMSKLVVVDNGKKNNSLSYFLGGVDSYTNITIVVNFGPAINKERGT